MLRVAVFVVCVVAASAGGDMRKCGRMMRPDMMRCCTSAPKLDATMSPSEDLKECMDIPMKPPSCDLEECIAKKKGFYAADGGIDNKALEAILEKQFKEAPEIFVTIKEKCINGDISQYGPPDMCDFMKMRHCIHMNVILQCPEWSDQGECSDMKTMVEECAKDDGDKRICHRAMHPGKMHCCTSPPPKIGHFLGPPFDVRECLDKARQSPPPCDREICIAKKQGYYADDGSLDTEVLAAILERNFKDVPEMFAAIKEKCLDVDISQYGRPDICVFMKMKHCIHMHAIMNCPDWSDEGNCSEMPKIVEECEKRLQ